MKRISNLLFSITALLFMAVSVYAQVVPTRITLDGVDVLNQFTGDAKRQTLEKEYGATIPLIDAEAASGQSLLITQPANGGDSAVVIVRASDGTTTTYSVLFTQKEHITTITGFVVGGTSSAVPAWSDGEKYDFDSDKSKIVDLLAGTKTIPEIHVLAEQMDAPAADRVNITIDIDKTTFAKGGKALISVYADNSPTNLYTINFNVAAFSDPLLTSITYDGNALVPSGGEYSYDSNEKIDITKLALTEKEGQTVRFVHKSDTLVRIEVISGEEKAYYNITYGKTGLDKSLSVTLKVETEAVVETDTEVTFNKTDKKTDATFNMKHGITSFPQIVGLTKGHKNQTVSYSYNAKENQTDIVVIAENGDSAHYHINYALSAKSDQAELTHIEFWKYDAGTDTWNYEEWKLAKNPDETPQLNYDVAGIEGWTVNVNRWNWKASDGAHVAVLQSETLTTVYVTSESGKNQNIYTFNLKGSTALPSIAEITLAGSPISTYAYSNLITSKGLDFGANVSANTQAYFILQQGDNGIEANAFSAIGNKSADPQEKATTIAATPSNIATLDKLWKWDASAKSWATLTADDYDDHNFTVSLTSWRDTLPVFFAEPEDPNAKIQITYGNHKGSTILVTAEDGVTTDTYTITYYHTPSNNTDLKWIEVNGDRREWTGSVWVNKITYATGLAFYLDDFSKIPEISWERHDSTQIVNVTNRDFSGVTLTVQPEIGTPKNYNLTFLLNTTSIGVNVLKSLEINGNINTEVADGTGNDNPFGLSNTDITSIYGTNGLFLTNFVKTAPKQQWMLITNNGGFNSPSAIQLFQQLPGGGLDWEVYHVPTTTSVDLSGIDKGSTSTEFGLFIDHDRDGVFSQYTIESSDYIDPQHAEKEIYLPYGSKVMPDIEVRAMANGQHINIDQGVKDHGTNKLSGINTATIKIWAKEPWAYNEIELQFKVAKGTSTSTELKSLTINGDAVDLATYMVAGSTTEYQLKGDSVPDVQFQKLDDALGQKVAMTITPDLSNYRYVLNFAITAADESKTDNYTIHLKLPYDESNGKLQNLTVGGFNTDKGTYNENKTTDWPGQLGFTRIPNTKYDQLVQTIEKDKVTYTVTSKTSATFPYTINYTSNSDNSTLTKNGVGSIVVDGADVTIDEVGKTMTVADVKTLPTKIVVNIDEEGQSVAVTVPDPEKPNEYQIVVTAPDGKNTTTYTLILDRKPSTNANLIDLQYKEDSYFTFEEGTYSYDIAGAIDQPKWQVTKISDIWAEARNGQTLAFDYKSFTVDKTSSFYQATSPAPQTITVQPEDKTAPTKDYTIGVRNVNSTWTSLDGIAINGVPVPDFDPARTDYLNGIDGFTAMEVGGKEVVVTYSSRDAFQTITITKEETYVELKVEPEGGSGSKTYHIDISRSANRHEADFDHINIGSTTINKPVGSGTTYTIPFGDEKPNIKAFGTQDDQKITIEAQEDGSDLITVWAADGEAHKEFVVTYVDEEITDNTLHALYVDGKKVSSITLGDNTIERLTLDDAEINYLPNYPAPQQVVTVAADNKSVTVKPENGSEGLYKLNYVKSLELTDDASLVAIEYGNYGSRADKIGESFPLSLSTLCTDARRPADVRAVLANKHQSLDWSATTYNEGGKIATLVANVTSGNGEKNGEYKIFVEKDNSTDLEMIKIAGADITTADPYSADITDLTKRNFKVTVKGVGHDDAVSFPPTVEFVESSCQTKVVTPNADKTHYECVVTAEDGTTTSTYTVDLVQKQCDIKTLASLSLVFRKGTDTENTIKLVEGQSNYAEEGGFTNMNSTGVPALSTTITFDTYQETYPEIEYVLTCDKHSTATIDTTHNDLDYKQINITVTAQDGTFQVYTVRLNNFLDDADQLSGINLRPDDRYDVWQSVAASGAGEYIPYYNIDKDFDAADGFECTIILPMDTLYSKVLRTDKLADFETNWPEIKPIPLNDKVQVFFTEGSVTEDADFRYKTVTIKTYKQSDLLLDGPFRTYTLNFKDPKCNITTLKDIQLNGTTLTTAFPYKAAAVYEQDKTKTSYSVELQQGMSWDDLPEVTAVVGCTRQRIISEGWTPALADITPSTTSVTYTIVTKADNDEGLTYTITFTKAKSSVNTLASVQIDSRELVNNVENSPYFSTSANFDPATTDYTITIPIGATFPAALTYTLSPDPASFKGIDDIRSTAVPVSPIALSEDKLVYTIVVTAEDETTNTYTFTFVKETSNDNTLSMIQLDGHDLTTTGLAPIMTDFVTSCTPLAATFDASVENYAVTLAKGTKPGTGFPKVTFTTNEAHATWDSTMVFSDEDHQLVVTIIVTPFDHSATKTYTLTFNIEKYEIADMLSDITLIVVDNGNTNYDDYDKASIKYPTTFDPNSNIPPYSLEYNSASIGYNALTFPKFVLNVDPKYNAVVADPEDIATDDDLKKHTRLKLTSESGATKEYDVYVTLKPETDNQLQGITAGGVSINEYEYTTEQSITFDPTVLNYHVTLPAHSEMVNNNFYQFSLNDAKYQFKRSEGRREIVAGKQYVDSIIVLSQKDSLLNNGVTRTYRIYTTIEDCDMHMLNKLLVKVGDAEPIDVISSLDGVATKTAISWEADWPLELPICLDMSDVEFVPVAECGKAFGLFAETGSDATLVAEHPEWFSASGDEKLWNISTSIDYTPHNPTSTITAVITLEGAKGTKGTYTINFTKRIGLVNVLDNIQIKRASNAEQVDLTQSAIDASSYVKSFGLTLSPDFAKDERNFTIEMENADTLSTGDLAGYLDTLVIVPIGKNNHCQDIKVTRNTTDKWTDQVVVTVQNHAHTLSVVTYTFNITRKKNDENRLADININNVAYGEGTGYTALPADFDKDVNTYTITYDKGIKPSDQPKSVAPVAMKGTIVETTSPVAPTAIDKTHVDYIINTRSESGIANQYTLHVVYQIDENADLEYLRVGANDPADNITGNELSTDDTKDYYADNNWDASTTDYKLYVKAHTAEPILFYAPAESTATVEHTTSTNAAGNTVHTYIVTANDDESTKTYTVEIINLPCDLVKLDGIYEDVAKTLLISGFNPETKEYNIQKASAADVPATLYYTPECEHINVISSARTETEETDRFSYTFKLTTQAGDKKHGRQYVVTYYVLKETDATLKDITIKGNSIDCKTAECLAFARLTSPAQFNAAVLTYNVTVPFGTVMTQENLQILGVTNSTTATAKTEQTDDKTFTITVSAENTSETKVYTVVVTQRENPAFEVLGLNYKGTLLYGSDAFDANKESVQNEYHLSTTELNAISPISLLILPNMHADKLSDVVENDTIRVLTFDVYNDNVEVPHQTYTVRVLNHLDHNVKLADLRANDVTIDGFEPELTSYEIVWYEGNTKPAITWTLDNEVYQAASKTTDTDEKVVVTVQSEYEQKTGRSEHRDYTITFKSEPKSANANLLMIYVDGNALDCESLTGCPNKVRVDKAFSADDLDYIVYVPQGYEGSKTITAIPENPNAKVVVDGNTITVTPQLGYPEKTYTVTILTEPSHELGIIDITVDDIPVNEVISLYSYDYTVDVYHKTEAELAAMVPNVILTNPVTMHFIEIGDRVFKDSIYTINLKVYNDAGNELIYYVHVIDHLDHEAKLKDLTVDGLTIDGFDAAGKTYTIDWYDGDAKPTIAYETSNNYQVPDVKLDNDNTYLLVTKSEYAVVSGATEETVQQINFNHIARSDNAYLTNIQIKGEDFCTTVDCEILVDNSFAPDRLTYNVSLPFGQSLAASDITAVTQSDKATVGEVTPIAGGFQIVVTAEDGTTKTYTLNVSNRPNNNINIVGINVEGTAIPNFNAATKNYTINIAHKDEAYIKAMSVVPDFGAYTHMSYTETGRITVIKDSSYLVTLEIKAAGGATDQYYVQILNTRSHNALLNNITYNGLDVADHKEPLNAGIYNIALFTGDPAPIMNYAVGDEYQTVTPDASGMPNQMIYTVKSEYGETNTYIVNFTYTKVKNNNALLQWIKVNDELLNCTENSCEVRVTEDNVFSPDQFSYDVTLPYGSNTPTITAEAQDPNASVSIAGGTITVTAEDGTTIKTYTVNVTNRPSNNVKVTNILINGSTRIPIVDGVVTYDYSVQHCTDDYIQNTLTVELEVEEGSWKEIKPRQDLNLDHTEYKVSLSAYAGERTDFYYLNIHNTLSSNAQLNAILLDLNLISGFDKSTYDYTIDVYSDEPTPTITYTKGDEWQDVKTSTVGNKTTLLVTSEDGKQSNTYTVTFNVLTKSSDASLLNIQIKGADFCTTPDCEIYVDNAFQAGTETYNVEIPFGTTLLTSDITAILPAGSKATIGEVLAVTGGFQVTVTAEDGTTKTYTLNVSNRQNNNLNIEGINVDGAAIPNFDANNQSYTINIEHKDDAYIQAMSVVPDFGIYTHMSYTETGRITVIKDSSYIVTLEIAAAGGAKAQYQVNILNTRSHNALLNNITYNGLDVADHKEPLNPGSYTINLYTDDPTPIMNYAQGDQYQTVTPDESGMPNRITYSVASEYGETNTYIVNFLYSLVKSSNAFLSDIQIDGQSIFIPCTECVLKATESLSHNTFDYTVQIPYGYSEAKEITAYPTEDASAIATLSGNMITVVAQDGTTNTYTITFEYLDKVKSSDASLSDIQVNGSSVFCTGCEIYATEGLTPGVTDYEIIIPEGTNVSSITATATDNENAKVTVVGNTIIVVAEDGTQVTYTLTFTTHHEFNIDGIRLEGQTGNLIPNFDKEAVNYTYNVAHYTHDQIMAMTVEALISNYPYMSADPVERNVLVQDSSYMFKLHVEAQGGDKKDYYINVLNTRSHNAQLADMTGLGNNTFNPAGGTYAVEYFSDEEKPAVSYTKGDKWQKVDTLANTATQFSIRITSEEGSDQTIQTINYTVKTKSNDATLSNITINDSTFCTIEGQCEIYVTQGFNSGIYTYDVILPYGYNNDFVINAVANDQNAQVSISGNTITVTAEDGTTQTYTLNVTYSDKPLSNNAYLSDLQVSGVQVDNFDPTYSGPYTVMLNPGNSIPAGVQINPVKSENAQAVTIVDATNINEQTTIKVTAEDGVTEMYYYINYQYYQWSDNNFLSEILINDSAFCLTNCEIQATQPFSPDVETYEITLPYGYTGPKVLTATAQDANATIEIKGNTIVVTAENGDTRTYTVTFTYREKEEAEVRTIYVNREAIPNFDINTLQYDYYVYHRTESWILNDLEIWADVISPTTWEEIQPRELFDNGTEKYYRATIQIVSPSGIATNYTIRIFNELSNNAQLSDLRVNGTTIKNFDPATYGYNITLPAGSELPIVTPIKGDEYQTISTVTENNQTVITVTAEDGTEETYVINYTFGPLSNNAYLNLIEVNDATLVPTFDSLTLTYFAVVPEGIVNLSQLTYILSDQNATAEVEYAAVVGDTTKIVVTAQDGVTTLTYTVIYRTEGSGDICNAHLKDLAFFGDGTVADFYDGTIDGFDSLIFNYDTISEATVEYLLDVNRVSVEAIPANADAKVEISRAADNDTVTFTVKVTHLICEETYTVRFVIVPSSNTDIDLLTINGEELIYNDCEAEFQVSEPFTPSVTDYNIYVEPYIPLDGRWTIDWIKGNAQQEITLNTVDNQFGGFTQTLTVVAGDGTTKVYTLNFYHKSSEARLNNLSYNGNTVEMWNANAQDFLVHSASSTLDLDLVGYERWTENGRELNQVVEISRGEHNSIVVSVTAEDCRTTRTYTINLVQSEETNSLLIDLKVDGTTINDFDPETTYYEYFISNDARDSMPDIIPIPYDPFAEVTFDTIFHNNGSAWLNITVTATTGAQSEYIVFLVRTSDDDRTRAEVWDVGIVPMGGDIYKLASHKANVTFGLYDANGRLVQMVDVMQIDRNSSVDDPSSDGTYITVDADKVWFYCFFQDGKYRIERGKLMHR
ncbi:MAG: hypothetical protein IKN91_08515 [Paludibacteraceae bacterium]|nr:hypothetical protein [Paludibacteraceae bacterium]